MRYPKLRELKEAIKALIRGPYTSRFPRQPHRPYEKFRGRPYFYEEECTGCGACAQVCPTGAISLEDIVDEKGARRVLTIRWDICIFCGNCQANCLTAKGIVLSREFDFSTVGKREDLRQKIEKRFVLCECCGAPIVPADQYKWVSLRLGPLCFANASLLLSYLRLQGLAEPDTGERPKEAGLLRSDRIRLLCPACRRQAVITS